MKMTFLERIQVIERIDALIKRKATGSARDLAKRLDVSKSTVYELIEIMKGMGAEVAYCQYRKSFYYERDLVLAIGFVDPKKVKGGTKKYYHRHFSILRYEN